jgi:MATE family multidrug resistance protein
MGKRTWLEAWRGDGGGRELLRLAWPLILSNSFWTLQIALDRIFLSRSSSDAVAAAMVAAVLFWTPLLLFQNTANYATTFVAQYVGAGQPHRVGPVVGQALYFSVVGGLVFMALAPLADPLVALVAREPALRELEATYLRCLCFTALPTLVTAAVNSFFAGRGDSRTVLLINAVGLLTNAGLAYAWIFGYWGFPAWGIAGAGWATVVGTSTSALLGLGLMLRPRFRATYGMGSAWRFEGELFRRLLRYGVPNGLLSALDCFAFSAFLLLVQQLGKVQLTATSITFTINIIVILPALGIGQAVAVLVGQRLGENQPDLAARSTWTGIGVVTSYLAAMVIVFLCFPGPLALLFRSEADVANWEEIAALVPVLLRFVAVYSLFDAMNLVFSFALRGAGDTRFVTKVALGLSWPVMVLPTWAAWQCGWGLYWAWAFASLYIILLALTFLFRFCQGKWRSMRVIETAVPLNGETAAAMEDMLAASVPVNEPA